VDMVERYLIFKHKGRFNTEYNYKVIWYNER
jgi:hypothetical protein